jgi:hypothetical protein
MKNSIKSGDGIEETNERIVEGMNEEIEKGFVEGIEKLRRVKSVMVQTEFSSKLDMTKRG